MLKNKSFLTARNTLVIFAVTMLYCFVKDFNYSVDALYVLFIGDFSIAIAPRFLIGSILSLFKESFTVEWICSFLKISTTVFFLLTSFYIAGCLSESHSKHKNILLVLTAIFITFPFSITIFAGDIFGFIDIFCMVVLLICVFIAENRFLVWLYPILMCAGVFVHDAFITAYMVPCFGILAYCVIRKYGSRIWASICFVVSAISGLATVVYRFFFAADMVKMSEQEALEYLAKKGNCDIAAVSGYIEAFLYGKDVHGFSDVEYADNMFVLVKNLILLAINQFATNDLIRIISIIPLMVVFFFIWIKAIKNTDGFMNRLPYILFMLTVIPQTASIIISVDISRYISTYIIAQFLYLCICLKQKDENVSSALDSLREKPAYFVFPVLMTFITNLI